MKFSEAIRKGAAETKPLQHDWCDRDLKATCVGGAAAWAIGVFLAEDEDEIGSIELAKLWPELKIRDGLCPNLGCYDYFGSEPTSSRLNTVVHLNDGHSWSRRDIADWYEATFEEASVPIEIPILAEGFDKR